MDGKKLHSIPGKDPKIWLICPRCNSGSVIYKSRADDYGCRRCGAVFTADFGAETTTYKPHKGEAQ